MNSKKQDNNKSTPRTCMIDCHFCVQPFEKNDLSLAKCCMKRCNKNYCISCIKAHFNPEFDMQMYRKDTWICYLCQGICTCDRCKKVQGSDRKMMRKKSVRSKAAGEEEVELSGSNLSQNNMRSEPFGQPHPQDDLLQDFNEQEQESDSPVPQFKLYNQEEMVQFPPFYRKIAERRNKFYSFILKNCRKKRVITKKREPRTQRKENETDKND